MGVEDAPGAAAPVEPNAAEQPAPAEPPKSREPATRKNFAERMRELGYQKADDDPKPEPAAAEDSAAAPEKPAAAEPKPKVVDVNPNPKLEQLKALATELGYTLDGQTVALEEYHKFREHKRRWHESTQAELRAERQKLEAERKELLGEVEWAKQVKAARAAGDLDKLAQLHGWKDYAEQQQEAIQRFADPNYKRLRELEETVRQREEAEKKAREEQEQQSKTAEQRRVQQQYCEQLSKQMAESKDPLIKAFYDNPEFVWAIYQIQSEQWDGSTTVTPEQAIKLAARGASRTVLENMRAQYERLQRAFGEPEKPKAAPIPPKTKAPAMPRAEANGRGQFQSKSQERTYIMERLQQAIDEDNRRDAS